MEIASRPCAGAGASLCLHRIKMKDSDTRAPRFRLKELCLVVQTLAATGFGTHAWADETQQDSVQFNQEFLQSGSGAKADISRFNKSDEPLPGNYRADTYVNDTWVGKMSIAIKDVGDGSDAVQPCFDTELLEHLGADVRKLTPDALALLDRAHDTCAPIQRLIPDAKADFDSGELRLNVSIPQIALNSRARGYVDPKYWDEGVPAALLQYNANTYRSNAGGVSKQSDYLGLTGGINAGAWRFRYQGNVNHSSYGGTHYQSLSTYIQRDIVGIRGQLTVGDTFTDGQLFDSYGVRGVKLGSDDRMLPQSQRGYAPVVHGIANTNAKVQIRQNGNIIDETTVAPGAFEIDDLYPTGYGGDLQVIVTEADGSQHISTVPYAAAVNALRPGVTRYNAVVGQYRDATTSQHPFVSQFTLQRGLTNTVTLYGGVIAAEQYTSGILGTALNTRLGAFGFDVTQASARLGGNIGDRNGTSLRLSYSRVLEPTNTNIAIAAYRYSTSGFISLSDAMRLRQFIDVRNPGQAPRLQKSRVQFDISQSLGDRYGSLYATGSVQNYWNRGSHDTQLQLGYENRWKWLNYGVSLSRLYDVNAGNWDNRVMLTLNIPLGLDAHAPRTTTSYQHDSLNNSNSLQTSLSGTLGEDSAFSYGVNANYANGGGSATTTVGGNVAYSSPVTLLTVNASRSDRYSQVGAGMSGGAVLYGGGLAMTPNMSETVAIVDAPDAAGARLNNGSGLRVDRWGHAIVSGLQPYSNNDIELDPKGLPLNIQLKSSVQRTAPTAGAVVVTKFETQDTGKSAVLRVTRPNGGSLPFGSQVYDEAGETVGTVAQGSRIIATGLKADAGDLSVKWGAQAAQSCTIHYQLPDSKKPKTPFAILDGECR